MKTACRILSWVGVGMVLGPGSSFPNNYDAVWQLFGLLFTVTGTIGMMLAGRTHERQ